MGVSGAIVMSSMASSYQQSKAMEEQGEYEKMIGEGNFRLANLNAEDAIRRGEKDAKIHKQKVKGLIGSQRASMAAQGIDINSGSALAIQEDTAAIGAEDELTIRNNAWNNAWGFRMEAVNSRGKGNFAELTATNNARMTLLTGGMRAAAAGYDSYSTRNPAKAKESIGSRSSESPGANRRYGGNHRTSGDW